MHIRTLLGLYLVGIVLSVSSTANATSCLAPDNEVWVMEIERVERDGVEDTDRSRFEKLEMLMQSDEADGIEMFLRDDRSDSGAVTSRERRPSFGGKYFVDDC